MKILKRGEIFLLIFNLNFNDIIRNQKEFDSNSTQTLKTYKFLRQTLGKFADRNKILKSFINLFKKNKRFNN